MNNKNNIPLAFIWVFASALGFGAFSGTLKELASRYPISEVIFFLMAPIFIFAVIFLSISKNSFFPRGKMRLLSTRAILGFLGWACYFYSIPHLSLPIASMCYVSMPLFVFALAPFLIGEKLNEKCILWIIASFVGIIMLIEPSPAMFMGSGETLFYLSLGFFGALLAAIGQIANRKASASVSSETIVLYFALAGVLFSLPQFPTWEPIAHADLFLFTVLGLGGILSQYTFTKAFKYAPAGIVCTLGFIDEPICVLIGYTFFSESLDLLQWGGLLLLAIGISVLTFIKEEVKQKDNI